VKPRHALIVALSMINKRLARGSAHIVARSFASSPNVMLASQFCGAGVLRDPRWPGECPSRGFQRARQHQEPGSPRFGMPPARGLWIALALMLRCAVRSRVVSSPLGRRLTFGRVVDKQLLCGAPLLTRRRRSEPVARTWCCARCNSEVRRHRFPLDFHTRFARGLAFAPLAGDRDRGFALH
jgi:hypothetical protein